MTYLVIGIIALSMLNTFVTIRIMRYKEFIVEAFPTIITLCLVLIIHTILIAFELYWFSIALSAITIAADWICIVFNKSNK